MRKGAGSVWEVLLQVLVKHKPHVVGLIVGKQTPYDRIRDVVVRHGGRLTGDAHVGARGNCSADVSYNQRMRGWHMHQLAGDYMQPRQETAPWQVWTVTNSHRTSRSLSDLGRLVGAPRRSLIHTAHSKNTSARLLVCVRGTQERPQDPSRPRRWIARHASSQNAAWDTYNTVTAGQLLSAGASTLVQHPPQAADSPGSCEGPIKTGGRLRCQPLATSSCRCSLCSSCGSPAGELQQRSTVVTMEAPADPGT